jgi:zinc protease
MKRLLVVFALLVVVAPASAAPIAHREVLGNGIVLLVAERPAVPLVTVRVFSRAGAVVEPPDLAGLANLTGSVVTRGTAKRSAREIDAAIEFVGGRLGADAGRDGLTVSLTVVKRDLALGLDLLQEVLLTPSFPEDQVQRKIREIQAAIQRSEDDPGTVAARALSPLVFGAHPYGRPAEGTRESVGRLTRDAVVKFYADHVRPDTTVIAVVGAITVAEARAEIGRRFGAWTAPARPASVITPPPAGLPPRRETIKRDLTQATIMLGRQAVNQRDSDYFPLAVASYILGGGSTSRLYASVREEGGLAYSVFSYLTPGNYGAGLVVSTQTRTSEVPKVIDILRREATRIGREPVTEAELSLAKSYLIGSFVLRLDTAAKVANFLVALEELGLGLDYADLYRQRITAVTAADVQRVAARYFPPDTFSQVIVGNLP